MPFYLRKQPLEIPPPTEKDWIKKDEEEDIFLKDPHQAVDSLPQPYRMINKLLGLIFDEAWEIIAGLDRQEIKKQLLAPTLYQPSDGFQVVGRANCLAAAGDYIFIGLSTGLSVFSMPQREKLFSWEAVRLEVCAIRTTDLGNGCHLLGSVDEMGVARLFYFIKDTILHIKAINEVEDVSKRTTCAELELSRGGDYAAFLLQGISEAWLEIYRLPKDAWRKELEYVQTVAAAGPAPPSAAGHHKETKASHPAGHPASHPAGHPAGHPASHPAGHPAPMKNADLQVSTQEVLDPQQELQQMLIRAESRLAPPALILRIKSPKPVAGTIFRNPFEALMKCDDGNVFGVGQNHLIKQCQWDWQEALFYNTFQQYLDIDIEQEDKVEKPSYATFYFHLPGRMLPFGTEPDTPITFSFHWCKSNNICFYLLTRPPKEKVEHNPNLELGQYSLARTRDIVKYVWTTLRAREASTETCAVLPDPESGPNFTVAKHCWPNCAGLTPDSDPKPDIVWPCAAPIVSSAITPCSSYLAFACEDGTITVWDKFIGFPLSVTVLREEYIIRSIHFLPLSLPPSEKTSFSSKNFARTKVQLLVLCTDGTLHLITSGAKEFSTKLLADIPESPGQTISAVATIPTLPNAVLIFFWEGTVGLMDIVKQDTICHFIPPPLHTVASPWQPVFSVDTDGQYLILRGEAGGTADTETIFLFEFKSYPFMESLADKAELLPDYLPWDKQCNTFLGDSLERLSTISQQMPECWSQLQTYAAALQAARLEK